MSTSNLELKCPGCLVVIDGHGPPLVVTTCGHMFHLDCWERYAGPVSMFTYYIHWLTHGVLVKQCPVCQTIANTRRVYPSFSE